MSSRFEKFSERARRVLSLAQEEAQRFNHNYIVTEHILLGLVRETDGVAARVLSSLNVELSKVRSAVEFIIGRGERPSPGDIGLTPRAKKVIELAVDEARRLSHHYIGTEHLLIGIMRGAAPMIDVLSRIFKLKCAYLAVESYSGKGIEDEQGNIVFSREMSSIAPNMGGRILLCDDLSDTGITFNKSIDWLKKYEPIKNKIEDIKTATLFKKKKSTFEPDFCAVKLPDNPWIVQPFEIYEEIRIEDIKKKHQK